MDDNSFESYPGERLNPISSEEALARADAWQSAMSAEDTPPFTGDDFISLESVSSEATAPEEPSDIEAMNNKGLMDAAAIVNYGLNAAAKQYGVETVVQRIKSFNASGSADPVKDLLISLGVDTPSNSATSD